MYVGCLLLALLFLSTEAQFGSKEIDLKKLKCLVCQTAIKEFKEAVASIDPTHKVDIGGYKSDTRGDFKVKQVPMATSEIHLSTIASAICTSMDDYIRGTWKDDGTLTIFKLFENGNMSPKFSLVDIIQDADLNKSIKYYCEDIMGEHEDLIIEHHLKNAETVSQVVCIEHIGYCTPEDYLEIEHIAVPGSENNFASQFGLNENFEMDQQEQDGTDMEEEFETELKDEL